MKRKFFIYILLALTFCLLFVGWSPNNWSLLKEDKVSVYLAWGRLSGLWLVYFVLAQLLLISRAAWLEKTFGLDRLLKWHRYNGQLIFVFVILHPILIALAYNGGSNAWQQLQTFFARSEDIRSAIWAAILFLVLIVLAVVARRIKIKYQYWYATHLLLYLAIILAWGHQLEWGWDFANQNWFVVYWYALYAFVAINLLWYKFLRPLILYYQHRFYLDKIVFETSQTVSLYITGRNINKIKWLPGQFANWRFLAPGFFWESHPFSISNISGTNTIRLTVKNLGDFSLKLQTLKPGTKVIFDGPYGRFHLPVKTEDKFLFIAGGAGITPLKAMLEAALPNSNIVLLFFNRLEQDIIFKNDLQNLSQQGQLKLHFILSKEDNWTGEKGTVDAEKIQRLVPDFKERQAYICGPGPMMDAAIKTLKDLGVNNKQLHWEKFSW